MKIERHKTERHKVNPFVRDMLIPVKGRQVRLSRLGEDDNVLINQETGEELGTHVTTYKKVDGDQFVKLFTQNIAMTFDFTSAGIKAFGVLLWSIQNKAISKDEVYLDVHTLNDFLQSNDKRQIRLSLPTFSRGIKEMENAKIVAKTIRQGIYFINPNFVFNGDRIAFSTVIERANKREENPAQNDLLPDLLEKALEDNFPIPDNIT